MKTDGIILDIDGTIWNTTEVVANAWNRAIRETGINVPEVSAQILREQFGKPMNVIADNLFKGIGADERQELLEACCTLEQKAVAENKSDITYPGVVRTIEELSHTHRIFIVSNCHDGYIELTMRKNDIEKFITDWECFGHNGKSKAENIRLIIKRNSLKNPVYVGDTEGDLQACEEAGVPFLWASYGFGKNMPEKRISGILKSFNELTSFLAE